MKISITGTKSTLAEVEKEFSVRAGGNLKRKTAAFIEHLRLVTPVDTGKARDSWRSEKTPEGYAVINDVEYIDYLNKGSSKQAPAHFVEATALNYGTPQGAIVESKK